MFTFSPAQKRILDWREASMENDGCASRLFKELTQRCRVCLVLYGYNTGGRTQTLPARIIGKRHPRGGVERLAESEEASGRGRDYDADVLLGEHLVAIADGDAQRVPACDLGYPTGTHCVRELPRSSGPGGSGRWHRPAARARAT